MSQITQHKSQLLCEHLSFTKYFGSQYKCTLIIHETNPKQVYHTIDNPNA